MRDDKSSIDLVYAYLCLDREVFLTHPWFREEQWEKAFSLLLTKSCKTLESRAHFSKLDEKISILYLSFTILCWTNQEMRNHKLCNQSWSELQKNSNWMWFLSNLFLEEIYNQTRFKKFRREFYHRIFWNCKSVHVMVKRNISSANTQGTIFPEYCIFTRTSEAGGLKS